MTQSTDPPQGAPTHVVQVGLPERWPLKLSAATLIVIATAAGATWAFGRVADLLIQLLLTFFLAFAMLPAVDALARRGWKRGPATGVVMLGVGGLLLGFALAILSVFIDQVQQLVNRVPEYADQVERWLDDNPGINLDASGLDGESASIDEFLADNLDTIVGGAFGAASSGFGLLLKLLTVSLFLFYALADAPRWRAALLRRMKPERQATIDHVLRVSIQKTGTFVSSRGALALISAVLHSVLFWALDLPSPLAMGMWMGVASQFVPVIGTYLGAIAPALIALLDDPTKVIVVIIAIVIYQQIENYVLVPRLVAGTMKLHPAVGFGAALAGGSLLGAMGALLALPVAATVSALVSTYAENHEVIDGDGVERPAADRSTDDGTSPAD